MSDDGLDTGLPSAAAAPIGADDNPYAARLAADPSLGEVGLWDRAKANLQDSWMRGSLFGAGSLMGARAAVDDPNTNPRVRALMSTYLDRAATEMARYDAMPSATGVGENMAALMGQIGGGFGSPEGYVTRVPGVSRLFAPVGDRFAGRVAESAATQGVINAATDPLVQAASIESGLQQGYDWQRTALAPVVGAAGGAVLHAGVEGVTQAAKALSEAFKGRQVAAAPAAPGLPGSAAGPAPDGLPTETAKATAIPKGESIFGPGDRITVNDYSTGPDVPAGPYNGQSGTIIERLRNGYKVRLDDGTETSIGEVLLEPAKDAALVTAPVGGESPVPAEAPNTVAPAPADEAFTHAGQSELPGTPSATPQAAPEGQGQALAPEVASPPEAVQQPPQAAGTMPAEASVTTETARQLKDRFTEADGRIDLAASSDRLSQEVGDALSQGKRVAIFPDGKPVQIVSIARGMMQDAEGQRWGIIPLLSKGDMNAPAVRIEAPAQAVPAPAEAQLRPREQRRDLGLPFGPGDHLSMARNTVLPLTRHADYKAAKGGDAAAAVRVARDLIPQDAIDKARERWGSDVIYVPVTAEERSGRNALPLGAADRLVAETGARVSLDIVQTNRVHHTGAKGMHRLLTRATFDGPIERGARYVLVDDVTTMGSTLADLADHIQRGGGEVVGAFTLADRIRKGLTVAPADVVARIRRKFGDEIFSTFGLTPDALTADEARFLDHARNLDDLRGRIAEAMGEGHIRSDAEAAGGRAEAPAAGSAGPRLIGSPIPSMAQHRVATADGGSIDVAPVVVEARDLKASSDKGYDSALQPRNRDRAASQAQIADIAGNLDPERLGISSEADRGAPIVGDDGMVESGNGRVMAIRQAYEQESDAAAAYRTWLKQQGVNIDAYEQPVLVRQRLTPMTPEERQAFAVSANRAATLGLSASERAMADGRVVSDSMLDLIRNPDDLGAIANRDFARAFINELPQAEQGGIVTAEGGLSSEGVSRIRNAILARAYGDASTLARIAEATGDEVKSISSALVAVAPEWAKLRADIGAGRVRADLDLTPELLDAVQRTADMRSRGQKLDAFLAQIDAFDRLSPEVEGFMRMFSDANGRRAASAQKITERLHAFATEARKVAADEGLALGLPKITVAELQAHAAKKGNTNAEAASGSQERLFRSSDSNGPGHAADGGRGSIDAGLRSEPGAPGTGGREGGQAVPGRDLAFREDGAVGVEARTGEPEPGDGGPAESLQRQALNLARELDMPLRQGRIQPGAGRGKRRLGQFDTRQGVSRVREIPDIETVAHEAGHYVEKRVGPELSNLIKQAAAELGPMDYDKTKMRPAEGFAEFVRQFITAPAAARSNAPRFEQAFMKLVRARDPELLMALGNARAAYSRWIAAPSGEKLATTVVRRPTDSILESIRNDGLPRTIGMVMSRAYEMVIDNRSPVRQAVRALARQAFEANGKRMDLRGGKNPELLARMLQRSHQASIADASYGVRPYHKITPEGPALRDAIVTALGKPSVFGSWNDKAVKTFSDYLVARRGLVLWDKYDRGALEHRPMTLTRTDLVKAVAEAEKANPNLQAGAGMVHSYTRQLLRKMFEGGLIERELYEKLLDEPFYVPFYRDLSEKPLANSPPPIGANMPEGPGTKTLVHRIRGSDRDIIDPLQSIMTQTLMVNRTLAHNDVLKSFVGLARAAAKAGATSTGRILEEIPPEQLKMTRFDLGEALTAAGREHGVPKDDIKILLGAITDAFDGEDPIMAPVFKYERAKPNGEPIMFWKEGGQMRAVRLTSREEGIALYESLVTLPSHARDIAMTVGSLAATAKRIGIVTNPIFALTNWTKDQIAAAIIRPDYVPFNPRGLLREVTQDQAAQLYAYAGGVSPGAAETGLDAMFDGDIRSLAHKGWVTKKTASIGGLLQHGDFVGVMKAAGEAVEVGEAGTRLNVFAQIFKQMKHEGFGDWDSMLEAAYQSTDLMDFGRHGSGTEQIRRLIPFLNAHIIGLDKSARTLLAPIYNGIRGDLVTQNDVQELKNAGLAWAKVMGVGGALGYLYGLWASRYEPYQDANDRLRASHLVVPGDAFGQPGVVLVVPKPYELAIGFNAGELMGLYAAKQDPRVGSFAMHGLEEVLAPPSLLSDLPVLSTAAQTTANYSFFTGRPIVPERLQGLDTAEQYTERTSPLAKVIGQAIGVSPIKIDFAVGDSFGLWGRDLINVTNQLRDNSPSPRDTEMFGLRRILKDANVSSMTTQAFWDSAGQQTGEFAKASGTYSAMLQQRRDSDAMEYLSHLPADKRAFVTLQQAADEDGKPVFSADEKRLHPYTRASTAALMINDFIRQINGDSQFAYDNGQPFSLSPTTKRALIDNMRQLQALEQRNAMVIMQAPGYAMRKVLSTEDAFDVIMAIDPQAGTELATRYATAKILPTEAVAKAWPEAQQRLLREGSNADLADLADVARADGYAFGAERVVKPRKRRVAIPGVSEGASN